MMPKRITNEIKKSIKQTITVLTGTISRGKYTFVSKFEFEISELLDSLKDDEKNCQGSVAAETSSIRGTPSGTSELNNQPIKAITKIVRRGRSTAHRIPIAVCL